MTNYISAHVIKDFFYDTESYDAFITNLPPRTAMAVVGDKLRIATEGKPTEWRSLPTKNDVEPKKKGRKRH